MRSGQVVKNFYRSLLPLCFMILFGCGLLEPGSILNLPTVALSTPTWTIKSGDSGTFYSNSYGVDLYYKIYKGNLSEATAAYNSDYSVWTNNILTPSSAAASTVYFAVYLEAANSILPNPSFNIINATDWSLSGNCAFTNGGIEVKNSVDGSDLFFFRRVTEDSVNADKLVGEHKSFKEYDFKVGDNDLPSSFSLLTDTFYVGIMAFTKGSSIDSTLYSQAVQIGLFGIPD